MADKTNENVEVAVEDGLKEKEAVVSPKKDKKIVEEKPEKENGDSCEKENGKDEEADEDSKESDEVCLPIKRKSVGDVPDGKPTDDGASPEKKAKLDDAAADAESNGEAEIAA